ncbi:TIR-like protein FxsC [Sphaerisporangium sp. NPDC049002]|uniref:TIR-like protein FxsC n=1 Tax=unclassified Sphaerisporangium TaxID=2630420 RepID=UPI0033D9FD55
MSDLGQRESGRESAPGADGRNPYFFLSYEPTPKYGPDDMGDPDMWVVSFFEKLCAVVSESVGLPLAAVGHLDRERPRTGWSARTATALETCKVFVPLYTPRYFASERCGREWSVFARRIERSVGEFEPMNAIVPVLWVPTPLPKLPTATEPVKFESSALGETYQRLGLYGIMRTGLRDEYEISLRRLAQRIVEVAESARVLPGSEANYHLAQNAFTGYPRRKLQIILAPAPASSPDDRSDAYYGGGDSEWNPYYPHTSTSLAEYATDLVRNLEYAPEVLTFRESSDQVLGTVVPTAPAVLIVDPWAAGDPELLDQLRQLDDLEKPWIDVIVPWNRDDERTNDAEAELVGKLENVLRRRLLEGRMSSRISARDTSTIEEFGRTLRAVVHRVGNQYLKHATAHPPAGLHAKRLRLRGPDGADDLINGED